MANNAHIPVEDIALVLQGKSLADMSRLVFRDPNHFRVGELHRHTPQWCMVPIPKSLAFWRFGHLLRIVIVVARSVVRSVAKWPLLFYRTLPQKTN